MCSVAKMELFSFIVICEGRVWTVKFILYHQLQCLLQGADRCIHWCGPHGLSITFPPEISRKFYFRVWTFLKLLTDLPRFLSTSLCLYESVTNWMVHHDTIERLRHPLSNLDVLEEGWELPVALGQVLLLLLLYKHIHARVTSEKSWQTHWWRETY